MILHGNKNKTIFIPSNALNNYSITTVEFQMSKGGRHDHDGMVVGYTTTYAISANHHCSCEFRSRSWRGALHTTLCDKVCQ